MLLKLKSKTNSSLHYCFIEFHLSVVRPSCPHCLRRRSQFAFGLVLPFGKSIAYQAIALFSHKSYAFAGALNCYPLGLWLGRSIIVPICIHRPQSCRLLHDADICRSYSFPSQKEGWSRSKTIVLAYPSLGSSIPECIRLPVMLHRRYLACFLCKINLLCGFRHRKFIYDVTHDISVRWSKRVHNTCKHSFLITW